MSSCCIETDRFAGIPTAQQKQPLDKVKQNKGSIMKTKQHRRTAVHFVYIAAGSLIMALAYGIFMLPHKIAPGGVSGVAAILYHISGGKLLPGAMMLLLNLPLFLIGIRELGGVFGLKTVAATLLYSLFVDLIHIPSMTSDPILAAVFGGALMGGGLGLVLRANATTGGTDLLAKIVHNRVPYIGVSWVLFIIDSCVVVAAGITFGASAMLYALITLFIASKAIDLILGGLNTSKCFLIVSNHTGEIAQAIFERLDRGATILKGSGAYTGDDKNVIMCVVPRLQVVALKTVIHEIDPMAFVTLSDVHEVFGEGFKPMEGTKHKRG